MGCFDQPGLMPLSDGIDRLLEAITPTNKTEIIELDSAAGRILAEDIIAKVPVPGFDNSAMDGYAVSINNISINSPIELQGKSFAGRPYQEPLQPDKCIRIMTGAAMPAGADTVIMQENATQSDGRVTFTKLAQKGNNVRYCGEDIAKDHIILTANTQLNSVHLALIASVGCSQVSVYQKTTVGLISTGDELKRPGQKLEYGDIYNSNTPAIKQMLLNIGADVIDYGILPDDPDQFRQAFKKADNECDFILTSGGVSVGEADYTKDILGELGDINFWKLAIKPGKPFAFGTLPNSYFIGLPGNPVSAIVTFHILACQAIRQHQQVGYSPMVQLKAILKAPLKKSPGRMDFQRGQFNEHNGQLIVNPTRKMQGSHILSSLSEANCYIVLEEDRADILAGEEVTIWLFDKTF